MMALAGPLDRLNERPQSQNENDSAANQQGSIGTQNAPRRFVEAPANLRANADPQEQEPEQQAGPNENALLGDRYAQGIMAIAAIAATAVAGLTFWLLYLTFQQTQVAASYAAKTFKQTKAQTSLAKKGARKSQRISRDQSRAYVRVSAVSIKITKGGMWANLIGAMLEKQYDYAASMKFTFENAGATPTKNVHYFANMTVEAGFGRYAHRWLRYTTRHVIQNLAPKSSVDLAAVAEDTLDRINEFQAHRQKSFGMIGMGGRPQLKDLIVRGRVVYTDIFDQEFFSDFGFRIAYPVMDSEQKMDPIEDFFPAYQSTKTIPPIVPPTVPNFPI